MDIEIHLKNGSVIELFGVADVKMRGKPESLRAITFEQEYHCDFIPMDDPEPKEE